MSPGPRFLSSCDGAACPSLRVGEVKPTQASGLSNIVTEGSAWVTGFRLRGCMGAEQAKGPRR